MTTPNPPGHRRRSRLDRDRALSRVTAVTVAGGAGAVLATGAMAAWLSTPAHAHPGSAVSSSSSSSSSSGSSAPSSSDNEDGGLSATEPPTVPGNDGGSQQQPPVVSGGS